MAKAPSRGWVTTWITSSSVRYSSTSPSSFAPFAGSFLRVAGSDRGRRFLRRTCAALGRHRLPPVAALAADVSQAAAVAARRQDAAAADGAARGGPCTVRPADRYRQ